MRAAGIPTVAEHTIWTRRNGEHYWCAFLNEDAIYSDHPNIQVSLDVELKDSYLDLSSGDEIVVYYDGSIIDEKAETVYAITLRTPANRETQ